MRRSASGAGTKTLNRPLNNANVANWSDAGIWVMGAGAVFTNGPGGVSNELTYEKRYGTKNQLEFAFPFAFLQRDNGNWVGGIGDLEQSGTICALPGPDSPRSGGRASQTRYRQDIFPESDR